MAPAVLTQKEIDQIAERWSARAWDDHEQAFARQWMKQAQEDIALLVGDLRAAQEGARQLYIAITKTVDDIEGDDASHVGTVNEG